MAITAQLLSGIQTSSGAPGTTTDALFQYVSLLLNGETQLVPFNKDASSLNLLITPFGAVRNDTSSPFTNYQGSGYFNGTTDYLTSSSTTAFKFASDFTVEAWIYPTATPGTWQLFFDTRSSGSSNTGIFLYCNASGYLVVMLGSSNGIYTGNTDLKNKWSHVAVTRTGSTCYVFINGTQVATAAVSTNFSDGNCIIGKTNESASNYFAGYVSNLRVVNGTAVYTSSFTPSTVPLIAVNNTSLLTLQNMGAASSSGVVDSGPNNLIITKVGTPSQGVFSPYSQTGWSGYFNGSTDYLTVPTNSIFGLPGQFTLEFWAYFTSVAAGGTSAANLTGVISSGGFCLYVDSTTGNTLNPNINSSSNIFTSTFVPANNLNQWIHIAVTRNSSNLITLWVNGASAGSGTNSTTFTTGAWQIGNTKFAGYISNFRITSGSALYTSTFIPSITPLTTTANTKLLTLQSNMFKDVSASNFTVTPTGTPSIQSISPFEPSAAYFSSTVGGSLCFNGTTDGVIVANSAAFGTNNYTVEAWIYPTANNSGVFFSQGTSAGNNINLSMNGMIPACYYASAWIVTGTTIPLNAWAHIALVRSGNTLTMYTNGVAGTPVTRSDTMTSTSPNGVGMNYNSAQFFSGYVSNLRVVNGSAVYTSSFTPPGAPLSAISNTQLLLNASNTGFVDATGKNNIQTIGSAQTTRIQSKFGSGSLHFTGSTDYIRMPITQNFNFGTGNFTIEFWIYQTANATTQHIFQLADGGVYAGISIDFSSSTTLSFNMSSNGSTWDIVSGGTIGAISLNTWNHIAVARNGNAIRSYLNGVQTSLTTSTASLTFNSSAFVCVGGDSYTGSFAGYIDDLRVTKGVARYLGGFAVPTSPAGNNSISDQYFNQVSLLLHADGLSGVTKNNAFLDSSSNAITISSTSTPTQGTFTPFASNWSTNFNGSTDYISVTYNSALSLISGNWTIECWIYLTSTSNTSANIFNKDGIANSSYSQYGLQLNGSGKLLATIGNGTSLTPTVTSYTGTTTLNTNQWYHVALVMNGSTGTLYLNGNVEATGTQTITMQEGSKPLLIGYQTGQSAVNYFPGHISNFRIVKGTAVYTSSFIPQTSPLTAISGTSLLTLQDNRIKDNSGNNLTITASGSPAAYSRSPFAVSTYSTTTNSGSMYLNGSSGLTLPYNISALALGSNNFTCECWLYPTALNSQMLIFSGQSDWNTAAGTSFVFNVTNGTYASGVYIGSTGHTAASPTVSLNTWTHVAWVRNGTTFSMYKNGVLFSSATGVTGSVNAGTANNLPFVGYYNGSNYFTGYISNLRLVNGTALYTGAFTPPTAPLTAVTNTSLLLSCTNGAVIDNSSTAEVILAGSAQVSTSTYKFGTGSISFNGTTDYAYIPGPSNENFAFGTGDYTVEMWAYPTSTGASSLYDSRGTGASSNYYPVIAISNTGITYYYNGTTAINGGAALTLNAWQHVALCRINGQTRLFVGGIQVGSTYADTGNCIVGIDRPLFGRDGTTSVNFMGGYIDDIRVTKGVGRYSTTFTPPTASFSIN